jgi:hypothetical protein
VNNQQYRNPRPIRMLLDFATANLGGGGQSNPKAILGTHFFGTATGPNTLVQSMRAGNIIQGKVNNGNNTWAGCMRLNPKAKALRLRPYVIAASDPSAVAVSLGLSLMPKFYGDKTSDGGVYSPVADDATSLGMSGAIALTAESAAFLSAQTVNPFTGQPWGNGLTPGASLSVYPVTAVTLTGTLGRLISAEGFNASNTDSGYFLIDPSFSEFLIATLLSVATPATVTGILLAVDTES